MDTCLRPATLPVHALVLLLALLAPAPGAAFELQCSWQGVGVDADGCPYGHQRSDTCGCGVEGAPRWTGGQLTLSIEQDGGAGVSAAQFVAAAQQAAAAWSSISCAALVIDASHTLPAGSDARFRDHNNLDHEHGVFFVASAEEWYAVTGTAAGSADGLTASLYGGDCSSRTIIDTDIIINGARPGGWSYDRLLSTLVHEIGHAVGLGHGCLFGHQAAACDNACSAVMAAMAGDYTVPQQDDVDALCALYPGPSGGLGAACSGGGECGAAPLCVAAHDASYCTHACGACEDGFACREVLGQAVCVRGGAPDVGEACEALCMPQAACVTDGSTESGASCYPTCDPAAPDCPAGQRCVALSNGGAACLPGSEQQVGERCADGAGDCAQGLVCVYDTGDPPSIAHCHLECSPAASGACGATGSCVPLSGGGGACFAAAGPGQGCVETGYLCVDGYECAPGLAGEAHTCRRSCSYSDPDSCGPGEVCIRFVDANDNPLFGACFAEGQGGEGTSCVSHFDCAAGLLCVATGSADLGECRVRCNPAAPACPHAGQQCLGIVGSSDGFCDPAGGGAASDAGAAPGDSGAPHDGGGTADAGTPDGGESAVDADAAGADGAAAGVDGAAGAGPQAGGSEDGDGEEVGWTCRQAASPTPGVVAALALWLAALFVARRRRR